MQPAPEIIEMQQPGVPQLAPPRPDFLKPINMNTLRESVIESLYRDLKQIVTRIRFVVFPFGKGSRQLRVCTLGYSLFPMNVAAVVCIFTKKYSSFLISALIVVGCFFWSFKAASMYMDRLMGAKTKGLSLYPVFLFYIFLAFFTLEMSH